MQLKTLIILGVITIIGVGMAFILISKGYVRVGKPKNETVAPQTEIDVVNPSVAVESEEEPEEEPEEELEVEPEKEDEKTSNTDNLVVIPLEPIVVNLKGSFGRRYLKVTVNLGIEEDKVEEDATDKDKKKEKDKDAKEEEAKKITVGKIQGIIESKLVEIKDILISVLSTKGIEDVEGWADQDIIRDEIKDILNKNLGLNNPVKKVFFTEFVVQ